MEGRVPVADRRVVAPEGQLEIVVVVVANDRSFHFHGIASRLGIECKFAEVSDFTRERRSKVKIELAEVEAARRPLLVRRGKVHVPEASNLKCWVVSLHLPDGGL